MQPFQIVFFLNNGPEYHFIDNLIDVSQLPTFRFAKLPSPAIDWKIWKALYSHGCSVGRSVVRHSGDSSDVTLAFEDALL